MSEKTYPNMGENGHPPGKTFAELYKKKKRTIRAAARVVRYKDK
jgi:hypothetical protein